MSPSTFRTTGTENSTAFAAELELAALTPDATVPDESEPHATAARDNIDTKANKKYVFLILFALRPAATDHETL